MDSIASHLAVVLPNTQYIQNPLQIRWQISDTAGAKRSRVTPQLGGRCEGGAFLAALCVPQRHRVRLRLGVDGHTDTLIEDPRLGEERAAAPDHLQQGYRHRCGAQITHIQLQAQEHTNTRFGIHTSRDMRTARAQTETSKATPGQRAAIEVQLNMLQLEANHSPRGVSSVSPISLVSKDALAIVPIDNSPSVEPAALEFGEIVTTPPSKFKLWDFSRPWMQSTEKHEQQSHVAESPGPSDVDFDELLAEATARGPLPAGVGALKRSAKKKHPKMLKQVAPRTTSATKKSGAKAPCFCWGRRDISRFCVCLL